MTREKWLEHIQAVCGLKPMEKTAEYATWVEAVRWHHTACPDCPECKRLVDILTERGPEAPARAMR